MPPEAKIIHLKSFDLTKIEDTFQYASFQRRSSKRKIHLIAQAIMDNKFTDNVFRVVNSNPSKYEVLDGKHRTEGLRYARDEFGLETYDLNRYCPQCTKPTSIKVKYSTGKIANKLQPLDNCPVCNYKTTPILQKRTSGYQSNWNDKLKVLAWKASSSFVKQSVAKSKYRKLYDQIKKDERKKHPKKKIVNGKIYFNDGHIHNRAMRKVSKIFLAHMWQTWRRQLGLKVTEPYVNELLGHSTVDAFTDN